MKQLVLLFILFFCACMISYAQEYDKPIEGYEGNGGSLSLGYDIMLTDEVDGKWSVSLEYRNKRYFSDMFFAGLGLGVCFPNTKTVVDDYDIEVKTSQMHFLLPVFLGVGNTRGNYSFDTGPYLDWAVSGKTTIRDENETKVTRLSDQEGGRRVLLGWQFMLRLGMIYCGARLPFPIENMEPVSMLTVGITF